MKFQSEGKVGGNIPLAIVLAVVVQLASGVWWVSAKDRDTVFIEERVTHLETGLSKATEQQGQVIERLARIEERVNAQLDLLDRIEKRVSGIVR